ncbi:MAG: hypothetical protein WCF33_18155 [Pseudonocardiaceae bacterium]
MATYNTEIQWGGQDAPWNKDEDLQLSIANRNEVIPDDGPPPPGTQVSWSGSNGGGNVTFFEGGNFQGTAQFPGEGPVGYRGTPAS